MADIDIFGDAPVKETPEEPMVITEPVKEITEEQMVTTEQQQPIMQEAIESTEEKSVVPEDGGTIDDDEDEDQAALENVEKEEKDKKKSEVGPYVSHTNTVQVVTLAQVRASHHVSNSGI